MDRRKQLRMIEHDRRHQPRTSLAVSVRVQGQYPDGEAWDETTATSVASTGGAASPAVFYLLFIVGYCAYFYRRREAVPYLVACIAVHSLPLFYDPDAVDEGLVAALEFAHVQRKTTLEMLAQTAGQQADSTSRLYARAALREVLAAR